MRRAQQPHRQKPLPQKTMSRKRRHSGNSRAPRPGKVRVAIVGTLGAVCVIVGSFAPMVRVQRVGTLRYWDMAGLEAVTLLASAILTLYVVLQRRHGFLTLTTVTQWGSVFYPYFASYLRPRATFVNRVRRAVSDTFTDMATDTFVTSSMVHPQWGMVVFVVGLILVTFAAVMFYG